MVRFFVEVNASLAEPQMATPAESLRHGRPARGGVPLLTPRHCGIHACMHVLAHALVHTCTELCWLLPACLQVHAILSPTTAAFLHPAHCIKGTHNAAPTIAIQPHSQCLCGPTCQVIIQPVQPNLYKHVLSCEEIHIIDLCVKQFSGRAGIANPLERPLEVRGVQRPDSSANGLQE